MNSNATNVQDTKEQYELVIRVMQENTLSIIENTTKFFAKQVVMWDVTIYATHWVGKKRLEGTSYWAIVCTTFDQRKKVVILDSSEYISQVQVSS